MSEPEETQVRYVGARITPELGKRFRVCLAKDEQTVQEVIAGLVEAWVRKKEAEHGG